MVWPVNRENGKIGTMVAAGKASSFSRPARRVETRPADHIPACIEPATPFVEGPGPGKAWWEKALSEKSFSGRKHENRQQNQGVGAKWRTTNLSPFGELIRQTGPMATANPFRFSTEYQDNESDLLYYGHRYYDPSTGRWLSRDPLNELGFVLLEYDGIAQLPPEPNLEVFIYNNPITGMDSLGLAEASVSDGQFNITQGKVTQHIGPQGGSVEFTLSKVPLTKLLSQYQGNFQDNVTLTVTIKRVGSDQGTCQYIPWTPITPSGPHLKILFSPPGLGVTARVKFGEAGYAETDIDAVDLDPNYFLSSGFGGTINSRSWVGQFCGCYEMQGTVKGSILVDLNPTPERVAVATALLAFAPELLGFVRAVAKVALATSG